MGKIIAITTIMISIPWLVLMLDYHLTRPRPTLRRPSGLCGRHGRRNRRRRAST